MTLIGADRPGLVDSLAAVIADQKANWTESRMAHLGGQFAGILRVETESANIQTLVSALERLDQVGLQVSVRTDDSESALRAKPSGATVQLELVGNDRPGIVAEVSHVLSDLEINVEMIHTECRDAPMAGGQLFHASAQLQLPRNVKVDEVRRRLEEIAADLMVDIAISS